MPTCVAIQDEEWKILSVEFTEKRVRPYQVLTQMVSWPMEKVVQS